MPDALAGARPLVVCLTGGGTAGHVTPHFALLPGMRSRGWQVYYIGSSGIERALVEAEGVDFKTVAAGKLRRYLSLQNLLDLGKIGVGCLQALLVMLRKRPDVVFSKGGFVAVPIAWAAWALRVPVVTHESDLTPGLATKLIAPLAKRVLYTFPETGKYLKKNALHIGTPVRAELLAGDKARALELCGFADEAVPTFLVMGGSQGAQRINEALLGILPDLVKRARVIHLTGKGKGLDFKHPRYKSFEYVRGELKDLYALADYIVSRAGANSLFEFLALKKPMLLIPLEQGSRGDQVVNAEAFEKSGWALVLREKDLTAAAFQAALARLESEAAALRRAEATFAGAGAAERVLGVLGEAAGRGA